MFRKIAAAALAAWMSCAFVSGIAYREAASVEAASSAMSEGRYEVSVSLTGGSGRAGVTSPCELTVDAEGQMTARIEWSSPHYDYMIVGGEKYLPVNTEGNAVFEIPVEALGRELPVRADTTAMSEPHEIDYILYFSTEESGATGVRVETESEEGETEVSGEEISLGTLSGKRTGSLELTYAENFSVDYYEGDYTCITIADEGSFLVIPENGAVPEGLDPSVVTLQRPLDNIYMAATACMDYFAALDAVDAVTLSGTRAEGWYVEAAREAMEEGAMTYAGKYSAPDYELIVSRGCDLAVESTMIYHNPEVKEMLEAFGVPVLVDRSSYESHPLGRVEWMKLYAALIGREQEAERYFSSQAEQIRALEGEENTGKTVAFFYITTSGYANVRRSGDYVAKMIGLAGGNYIFENTELGGDGALSTVNMGLEDFYVGAKDADYLIYNSTIDSELTTVAELLKKSPLFADFRAVKEGRVWCLAKSMYQDTTSLGTVITDMHRMLTEENPTGLTYLYRLE